MLSHNRTIDFKDKLIAHRGWQHQYPENSYAGIKSALQLGIRHIEIDIQLSADRIPVLAHDIDLQRLCGIELNLMYNRLSELRALSFHEPERLGTAHKPTHLLTLAECADLIGQYPEATLYVELKRKSLIHFGRSTVLSEVVKSLSNIIDQVALISFDIETLLLAKNTTPFTSLIPVLSDINQWHDGSLTDLAPTQVFCKILRLPLDSNTDTFTAKNLAYRVAVYEVDNYALALELINQGVDMIESFSCGELLAAHQATQ